MGWLVQGQPSREVISISGMAGSGKTTLVKQVYEDPGVKKHFAIRVWVTLSPYAKTEDVLKEMLLKIAIEIRKIVPSGANTLNSCWLKMMIKQFLQSRKYLVVLDDMWRMDRWDAVKYALPSGECGSRILLTTRYAGIASAASSSEFPGKIHEMQPLHTEYSWKLFCMKTFQDGSCPLHLKETCKYILRKCEGLPLPIVAISGVLASKDKQRVDEWDLVRRSLRSEIDANDRLNNLKMVLSLSFSDLPYYLKSCFLYLSVFPEGYVIQRKRLIRLWIAEGFVESKEGVTLEEVADCYLDELLNRNLVQVAETYSYGKVRACRIHELLREIITTKSRDQNFVAVAEEHAVWPDKVRRLSMNGTFQSIQLKNPLSHLRSFFMFYPDKESMTRMLYSDFKLLNVLDLRYAPLKKFPLQLVDNYCLRYLSFRRTEISTIPSSIGNLKNLETLDLKHTNVTELPIEIVKLKKLRHLLVYRHEPKSYTRQKYGFKTLAEIGELQALQELCYIEADDDRNGDILTEIGKLRQLRRLCILKLKKEDGWKLWSSIAELANLRTINISSLDDDECINLQPLFSPPQFLKKIYLKGRMEALPQWISNLHNLNILHLKNCQLKDDPMALFQGLPNLFHLEMCQIYHWKALCLKENGFKKLKILGLDKFDELRSIEVEVGALVCLEKLMIQRCKLLIDLPSGIEHLTKLKVLEFFDMPDELIQKIKEHDKSRDYQKVAHISELRYGCWTDEGWDVKSVERSGKEGSSSDPCPSIRSSELSPCWK